MSKKVLHSILQTENGTNRKPKIIKTLSLNTWTKNLYTLQPQSVVGFQSKMTSFQTYIGSQKVYTIHPSEIELQTIRVIRYTARHFCIYLKLRYMQPESV